ncbi:transposase [Roseivivax sp. CAU 1761]
MHSAAQVAHGPDQIRQAPIPRRHRIEIMFGRIKDWRRVATRYDRCPKVFLSAIALAATVIYWL